MASDYTSGHGGVGKRQKPSTKANGTGFNKSTPNAEKVPHAGAGGKGAGYDESAHSGTFHGKSGKAVGVKSDHGPVAYDAKTQAEGGSRPTGSKVGPVFEGSTGKSLGKAHTFDKPSSKEACGFGHPAHLRSGPLRMSGHSGAHRVGSRKK